jgi:hypothetical protein
VRPPIDRRGTFDMMSSASSATSRSGSPTQPPELTSNLILQSVAAGNPLGGGSLVQGEPALYPHPCATSADKARSQISLMKLLRTPGVALVIGNYGLLAILDIAFAALNPLFLASPVTLGGLGLTPAQIGTIMGGGLTVRRPRAGTSLTAPQRLGCSTARSKCSSSRRSSTDSARAARSSRACLRSYLSSAASRA